MSLITLEIGKLHDQHFDYEQAQQEEDEALSLCDLPITKIVRSSNRVDEDEEEDENEAKGGDFDFNFDIGSLAESGNALETEMCSADEVFSGGQILPFRHSVSMEAGLSKNGYSGWRSVSRSESMDRVGLGSRSSSIRSQYSSTSSTSTSSNNTSSVKSIPISKIKGRNNFHSHPSPKPQVWASSTRGNSINYASPNPISKKSTMWDVLRLGLVRAPEIENRHRVGTSGKTTPFIMPRNNSSRSINSESSSKINDLLMELHEKKKNGGIFKSCKCSVLAIEPIPTREIGTRSNYFCPKTPEVPENIILSTTYYRISKKDKELEEKRVTLQEQRIKI